MYLMSSGIGDKDYYTDSEEALLGVKDNVLKYLEKNNSSHLKPYWTGKLAETYGINKEPINNNDYYKIWDGYRPNGEKAVSNAGELNHQAGKEMVFTAPKSFSLLYSLASEKEREQLNELWTNSQKEIIKLMELELMPSNQKAEYRNIDNTKTEMIAGVFTHFENRNIDPHLHSHILLFNQANFTMKDGTVKTMAVDVRGIYGKAKYFTQLQNTLLAEGLKKLGYVVEEDLKNPHSFRMAGITQEQEQLYSDRSNEVKEFMEKNKGKYSSYADAERKLKETYRRTSAEKKEELSFSELLTEFDKKHKQNGLSIESFIENQKQAEIKTKDFSRDIQAKNFTDDMTQINGYITKEDFAIWYCENYRLSINTGSVDELTKHIDERFEEFLNAPKQKLVNKQVDGKYTTETVIYNERQIQRLSKTLDSKKFKLPNKDINTLIMELEKQAGYDWNEGQKSACQVITNESAIVNIIGDAGTGKTTTAIKFTNEYYKDTNDVIGLATQTNIASALSEAGINRNNSIAGFLKEYNEAKNKNDFFKKPPVIIIDEAGMVSAEHMARVLEITEKHNGKLITVGDTKQLSSVGYGVALKTIEDNINVNNQARLYEVSRQKTGIALDIATAFRDKETEKAVELMANNGLLITEKKEEEVLKRLVDDYMADTLPVESKIVIASTNSSVNALNDMIRNRLIETGVINQQEAEKSELMLVKTSNNKNEERAFCVGDRLVITENMKLPKARFDEKQIVLKNGSNAVIKRIDTDKKFMVMEIEGKLHTIDYEKMNKFNHSYAVTTHKSQGATKESSYVYSTGSTQSNMAYVNFSRHKTEAKLYITEDNVDNFIETAKKAQERYTTLGNSDYDKVYEEMLSRQKEIEAQREKEILEKKEEAKLKHYRENGIDDVLVARKILEKDITYTKYLSDRLKDNEPLMLYVKEIDINQFNKYSNNRLKEKYQTTNQVKSPTPQTTTSIAEKIKTYQEELKQEELIQTQKQSRRMRR